MELSERTAIVTGGSSGIGRAIALEFAREGCNVAIGDVRESPKDVDESTPTAESIRTMGQEAIFRETDVGSGADVEALVESAVTEWGTLDVLVNNAGISRDGAVHETAPEDWQDVVDVNLSGVYRCTREAMPYVRESDRGRIINVASQMGFVGLPESAAYCASKGGVVNLTRQMAVDYSNTGVTVNSICPGPIKTSMSRDGSAEDPQPWYEDEEQLAHYEAEVLTPFVGDPEDVARAAVFVASEDARFMTGHNLVVDGGYLAK